MRPNRSGNSGPFRHFFLEYPIEGTRRRRAPTLRIRGEVEFSANAKIVTFALWRTRFPNEKTVRTSSLRRKRSRGGSGLRRLRRSPRPDYRFVFFGSRRGLMGRRRRDALEGGIFARPGETARFLDLRERRKDRGTRHSSLLVRDGDAGGRMGPVLRLSSGACGRNAAVSRRVPAYRRPRAKRGVGRRADVRRAANGDLPRKHPIHFLSRIAPHSTEGCSE